MKYFSNKPPDISEIQLAIISTLIVNAMGSKKKAKVDDFIISKQISKKDKRGLLEPMPENEVRSTFAGISVRMD